MLIFPMKKEWYEKIKNGEKTIEYREIKPYWETRLKNEFIHRAGALNCPCIFRLGYTKNYMTAQIVGIEIVNGKDTDLNIDKPVYAIHFKLGALADVYIKRPTPLCTCNERRSL